ncbi:MAG: hypothetical protein PHN59_06890 [Candidatus Omnitrophica bacterium]|nr:hypothetical protein [Candidatus Omnitrophota bacterium]
MPTSGFNPKSRWDRRVPGTSDIENPADLKENITVLAEFQHTKIYPRAFTWKNKEYKIEKITYQWQERCGKEIICFFSVYSGTNLYQISFNNTSFGWQMDKIIE